jgi:hypothetical protein
MFEQRRDDVGSGQAGQIDPGGRREDLNADDGAVRCVINTPRGVEVATVAVLAVGEVDVERIGSWIVLRTEGTVAKYVLASLRNGSFDGRRSCCPRTCQRILSDLERHRYSPVEDSTLLWRAGHSSVQMDAGRGRNSAREEFFPIQAPIHAVPRRTARNLGVGISTILLRGSLGRSSDAERR